MLGGNGWETPHGACLKVSASRLHFMPLSSEFQLFFIYFPASAHPITSQCAVSETEEPRYFLNKDFSEISSITAELKVESRQDCETASKRQISIGSGAQSREQVRISSSEHQYDDVTIEHCALRNVRIAATFLFLCPGGLVRYNVQHSR